MLQTVASSVASERPAVVSKEARAGAEYLRLEEDGARVWVSDPATATAFGSMREAARMALRLPSEMRAFGMPLDVELENYQQRMH
jgi:hypothetical protein